MAFDLSNTLVIGISATALFDMQESDNWFRALRRRRFGKHVRANLDHYGLVFVPLAGTIAVYKKLSV